MRTSWIYVVKKEDLIIYLQEFNLDTSGTVDDLRKRFASFITENGAYHKERLSELESKHPRDLSPGRYDTKLSTSKTTLTTTSTTLLDLDERKQNDEHHRTGPHEQVEENAASTSVVTVPVRTSNEGVTDGTYENEKKNNNASIMDKVRKWSVRYDGNKDAIAFIDRVTELTEVYDIPLDLLPRTMPELLKDKALMWYRNNNHRWNNWQSFKDDFLQFFLPPRYLERLKDTIRERQQQPKESFKDFTLSMLDLMRHTNYDDEKKLDRIYRNSRHEFQLHIKRREFETLKDLLVLAGDYEGLRSQITVRDRPYSSHQHKECNRHLSSAALSDERSNNKINPRTACRRCGEDGHVKLGCRNPSKTFCWSCGRINVLTKDCCRKQAGNESGVREIRGIASPRHTHPRQ